MPILSKRKLYSNVAAYAPAPGAPAAYTFRGQLAADPSNDILTGNVDIGTASADRLIVALCATSGAPFTLASMIVNGVTLTIDKTQTNSHGVAICSGLVTSGTGSVTVSMTFTGSAFQDKFCVLYALTGLNSNLVKQVAGASVPSVTIPVVAGDFLFAIGVDAANPSFSGSTQSPTTQRQQTGTGSAYHETSADWVIASTNASFSIASSPAANLIAAATYR